jgi:hypothetical protein
MPFFGPGLATAQTPAPTIMPVERPRWQIGDEWIFETGTWIAKRKVSVRVTERRKVDDQEMYILQGFEGEELLDQDLNWKSVTLFGAQRLFTPVLPLFIWPADPGKAWQVDSECRIGVNLFRVRGPATVEKVESVKVPAGTFQAVRLNLKSRTKDFTYWYSPEVRYVVKMDLRESQNKIEYRLVTFRLREQ